MKRHKGEYPAFAGTVSFIQNPNVVERFPFSDLSKKITTIFCYFKVRNETFSLKLSLGVTYKVVRNIESLCVNMNQYDYE